MQEGQPPAWEHLKQRIAELEDAHNKLVDVVDAQRSALDLQHTMLRQLVAMAQLQQQFMRAVKEIIYQ